MRLLRWRVRSVFILRGITMDTIQLFDVLEESIFLYQDRTIVYRNPKAILRYGDTFLEDSFQSMLSGWIEQYQHEEKKGNETVLQLKQSVNQNGDSLSDVSVMKYESGYLIAVHDANCQNEFYAQLIHEMRSPLNIIQCAADLLKLKLAKDGEVKQSACGAYVQHIRVSCQKLKHLIDNVLDATKLKLDFLDLHMKTQPVVPIVKSLVSEAAFEAGDRTVVLEYAPEMEGLEIPFDAEKIERIVSNLISNAIKYTDPEGYINVKLDRDDEYFIMEVRDNGIGIRNDELVSIFEPFARASNAVGRAKGTGVGLYLVKQLVLSHCGDVQVESEEGVGSCFRIILPIRHNSVGVSEDTEKIKKL